MKLKDYLKELKRVAKENEDLEVFFSCDDEGNGFSPVFYTPSIHASADLGIGGKNRNVIVIN